MKRTSAVSDKNRHANKRTMFAAPATNATIGAISRKRNVICKMIEHRICRLCIGSFMTWWTRTECRFSRPMSIPAYQYLEPADFLHQTVIHREGEYVRGIVYTNNAKFRHEADHRTTKRRRISPSIE